ncbi:glucan 1,3-beta-glucosidase [Cantharellus anzutake]|uniref:glucan 1,3-beta-glucosidase n=1 Tax=Cantharellus anzutake TaxID=1750568 RepID=UPI001908C858|nr:glucan 1,3-beta-glucosidase [Cantharellus anzutake]KAF8332676.1 glucan 1,3-beta-glucosidase [Cantharellus anzutake]
MSNLKIFVPPAPNAAVSGILGTRGMEIVDVHGNKVVLKGAGLGGHLNMENFITGYAGHEQGMRRAVQKVLGEHKSNYFFHKLLEYFFDDLDAEFYASLGFNCLRIPFNYRHFEDDMNPGTYDERGFLWLDRIINICARHGIYTVLDMHTVPGAQNQNWHSDNPTNTALFWEHIDFQNRAIRLWEALAARYKGNTWVAGYNPLNEPGDEYHYRLLNWYERVEKAIRGVDPDHILFLDGNTVGVELFKSPLPNSVYAIHDYSIYGFPGSEPYSGSERQLQHLWDQYDHKVEYHGKANVPIWNGEFGPVYSSPRDGDNWQETNLQRYHLLKDQLSIYAQEGISWSIWLYKDIGLQGMVYVSPESPYLKRFGEFIARKRRLAADEWGADVTAVESVFEPLIAWFNEQVPNFNKYPSAWGTKKHCAFTLRLERVTRHILLSDSLCGEYAELFRGLTMEELDALAASFKYENCVQRQELNQILKANSGKE